MTNGKILSPTPPRFLDELNGENLFTEYGLVIQTGTAELLKYPDRKEVPSNDWREENGQEYDLEVPTYKDMEASLNCAILADDDQMFWQYYQNLFAVLSLPGWLNLYIYDHGRTYQVFYKKSDNFKKVTKRLKGVQKVFVKFQLTFQVKF